MENTKTNDKRPKVGAVWVKQKKNGEKYLSIQVELDGKKVDLRGWKNEFKTEDKHPSFNLFVAEPNQQLAQKAVAPQPKPAQAKVAKPEEGLL